MTKGEDFIKRGKCKNNHCSSQANSAWCDLNSRGNILKLHDKCPNPKSSFQHILMRRKSLLLRLINICWKEDQSKVNYKKFSGERKRLGKVFLNRA